MVFAKEFPEIPKFFLGLLKSKRCKCYTCRRFLKKAYKHICYQCFIVENKNQILWHIKQLFLQGKPTKLDNLYK